MVNTRAKGWRNKDKFIKLHREQGWLCDTVEKSGKFLKEKDMFGLWDVICIKKHIIKFVQITSNRHHKHTPYLSFAKQFGHHRLKLEQWVHFDYDGWVIYKYTWDMGIIKEDKRKSKQK